MTFSKRYLYLAIPIVILAAFFLLPEIQHIFKPEKQREAIQKYKERQNQSLENWRNANYVPIEHDNDFETKVRETIYQHKEARSLTSLQRQSLARATIQFIYAHHDGTWESFRAFRIPLNQKYVVFNPKLLSLYKSNLPSSRSEFIKESETIKEDPMLKKYPHIAESIDSFDPALFDVSSPMAVLETYWRLLVKRAYSLEGKPEYCTQCWQSLALENLQLKIGNIPKGHSNPQFVMYQRSTNAVSGGSVPGSSLSFRPSLDKLLGKGSVKAAYLSLLIRDNRDGNPYPVHVGYYWSPQHNKWLPMGIHIIGGDKKDSIRYFF